MLAPVLVPLRRLAVLGAAAVSLATVRLPGRPHTLCVFRTVTGLPCPLCGGTTAAVCAGRGELGAAFMANPFVVAGAMAMVLTATPYGQQALRSLRTLSPTTRVLLVAATLGLSEGWQLVRLGLL